MPSYNTEPGILPSIANTEPDVMPNKKLDKDHKYLSICDNNVLEIMPSNDFVNDHNFLHVCDDSVHELITLFHLQTEDSVDCFEQETILDRSNADEN